MMIRSSFVVSLLTAVALLSATGCVKAAPPWSVKRAAATNPVAGAKTVVVRSPAIDSFRVHKDDEAEWLKAQTEADRAAWEKAKAGLAGNLAEGVTRGKDAFGESRVVVSEDPVPPGGVAMRIHLHSIDTNWCVATVTVSDAQGNILEELEMATSPRTNLATWSVWQGLPVAVDNLGLLAVRYVKQRSAE
jgi:hypothetical protein